MNMLLTDTSNHFHETIGMLLGFSLGFAASAPSPSEVWAAPARKLLQPLPRRAFSGLTRAQSVEGEENQKDYYDTQPKGWPCFFFSGEGQTRIFREAKGVLLRNSEHCFQGQPPQGYTSQGSG